MATSSFDKRFVITDIDDINKILDSMENPVKISVREVNLEEENAKGIELLRKNLSIQELLEEAKKVEVTEDQIKDLRNRLSSLSKD